MIQSRKLVAAAILGGLALIVAGLLIAPFNASARAAGGQTNVDIAADRIGEAFASLSGVQPEAAIAAAAVRVSKGDLAAAPACTKAVWPNIDASCLSTVDGSPAPHVRTITIGYRADQNTTILVRIPAAEVVQR
jgi:hypothetical protein